VKSLPFFRAATAVLVALGLVAGILGTPSASGKAQPVDEVAQQAEAGEYLTVGQLLDLYYGRTWRWTDGAGYYSSKERGFRAYSGKGATSSYATGKWFITDRGRVCTKATWTSLKWKGNVRECLEHRTDGRRVFQRKLPNGPWYVFKNTPSRAGDVYNQLVPGDQASAAYERNKTLVDTQRAN